MGKLDLQEYGNYKVELLLEGYSSLTSMQNSEYLEVKKASKTSSRHLLLEDQ